MRDTLLRPGRLVDERGGCVLGVGALEQRLLQAREIGGGQEDDHGGTVRSKRGDGLALGHGRAAGHAGDDDGLAHAGQRVLGLNGRCRAAKARDAGGVVVVDAELGVLVHLLPDRTVEAGVARVQAHRGKPLVLRILDGGDDLLERHLRAVVDAAGFLAHAEQGGIDEAARIDADVRLAQKLRATQRDQVLSAAAGAHKMQHSVVLLLL